MIYWFKKGKLLFVTPMKCKRPYNRKGVCQTGRDLKALLNIGLRIKKGFAIQQQALKVETIEHILIQCRAYSDCKTNLYYLWLSTTNPVVLKLVLEALTNET